jgi:hypothetical protein
MEARTLGGYSTVQSIDLLIKRAILLKSSSIYALLTFERLQTPIYVKETTVYPNNNKRAAWSIE